MNKAGEVKTVAMNWTNPKTGQRFIKGQLYPVTYYGFTTWFRRFK